MSNDINQIGQQMVELQRYLQSSVQFFAPPELSAVKVDKSAASATQPAISPPPTYASMVTKTITESVSKAVAANIRSHEAAARDRASAVFFGVSEMKRDSQDVTDILKAVAVSCLHIAAVRLGRRDSNAPADQPRPLKVIFGNATDRESVLGAAKKLKGHTLFGKVRISRFLSDDEMSKLKETRTQCKQMNEGVEGQKPYIVINGRIMKKQPDGKLQPVHQNDSKNE